MPRWEVIEHREYAVTFIVDAPTKELAIQKAGQMSMDEGDEDEIGLIEVEARQRGANEE